MDFLVRFLNEDKDQLELLREEGGITVMLSSECDTRGDWRAFTLKETQIDEVIEALKVLRMLGGK